MANTVASQTILDGNRTAIQKFTFLCDGSGDESAVLKVDCQLCFLMNLEKRAME